MPIWQIVCIIDTLRADVACKIILKNYNEPKKKKMPPCLKIYKNQKNTKQNKINSSIKSKKEKKST